MTRFKRSSTSIRAWSRAVRSIAPDVGSECSSSDENEVSLAFMESRADFPEVSLQLLDPRNGDWRRAVVSAARQTSVLEARSILYAVRYVESNNLGRLLISSDTVALVLAECKGRTLLPVVRRVFGSGFRAGCVLAFRVVPSD